MSCGPVKTRRQSAAGKRRSTSLKKRSTAKAKKASAAHARQCAAKKRTAAPGNHHVTAPQGGGKVTPQKPVKAVKAQKA